MEENSLTSEISFSPHTHSDILARQKTFFRARLSNILMTYPIASHELNPVSAVLFLSFQRELR